VIGLVHYLLLAGILFAIAVAGIFINRKNVILLLMCIQLMLLAVNFNFVAFSRFLGNIESQVFGFCILTVAAAEAEILHFGAEELGLHFAIDHQLGVLHLHGAGRLGGVKGEEDGRDQDELLHWFTSNFRRSI
jgi:NADH-quinone oxidoreductase subunit K